MEYQILLGVIASVIGLVSYVPYFRDMFRGKTKPHPFSWFVWGLLTAIAFFAQYAKDAGAGSWATGITAVACLIIAVCALFYGEKRITPLDWWCFAGALAGALFWAITSNPVAAVIIVTVTDAIAFIPTFRKGYAKPYEETILTFSMSVLKFVFAIFALQSFSVATVLFPASLVLSNGLFVAMILIRRRQIATIVTT